MMLVTAEAGVFAFGWLMVAFLLPEARVPASCWSLYGVLEASAFRILVGGSAALASTRACAFSLLILSGSCATFGGDAFIHGRARHRGLWIGVTAGALAIQWLCARIPGAVAFGHPAYTTTLLLLLVLPLVLLGPPMLREFGRVGVLTLAPPVLMILVALTELVTLVSEPTPVALDQVTVWDLVVVLVSSGSFQLSWFALVIGRQVLHARHAMRTDGLTGLLQRSAFVAHLQRILAMAQQSGETATLAFIDVDRFKHINDAGGHAAGDRVLSSVAQAMSRQMRECDLIARWGGEEFLILMPATNAAEGLALMEQLRSALQEAIIPVPEQCPPLSLSIGVAESSAANESPDALIDRADRAMYAAKHEGGNRSVLAPPSRAAHAAEAIARDPALAQPVTGGDPSGSRGPGIPNR
jgi:diguanylate cyclase (GGDEF)-like protein